ncbi:hypothetical protein GUITHDRAFT_110978 [Guillardia theta CCMP2712]|uniref:JmjC domain-containing protein n=2 Tax=Guillardia theta TaxID=55529 RepID=L1J3P6_GUITC|nr:hypothetical protein GUITHDRAFT_110978 [Guillardia theta CCMP2712]EKX42932.1 hypothetical protein GUITHDRAFT_110978 [Guillardia theta CCMP2712]|eukprot:XP_005829912.1 hypothetical protein GUITHDRAFT_110978 [Guillardia theta CCMP2712]
MAAVRRVEGEEGKEAISLIKDGKLDRPVVLVGFIEGWPARKWTPFSLAQGPLAEVTTSFRFGARGSQEVTRENDCFFKSLSFRDFFLWSQEGNGVSKDNAALDKITRSLGGRSKGAYWGYADYKRFHELFRGFPQNGESFVDWSSVGVDTTGYVHSNFWYGSAGSEAQCHYDTYGYNLVAQLYGEKRWLLFPPGDRKGLMRPTRIPYEESSVFSDLKFKSAGEVPGGMEVVLKPGEVLYVPHYWWHQVEALSDSISVNSWVDLPVPDSFERVKEGIVRLVACNLHTKRLRTTDEMAMRTSKKNHGEEEEEEDNDWINPTEEVRGLAWDMEALSVAMSDCHTVRREKSGRGAPRLLELIKLHQVVKALTHPRVVEAAARQLILDHFGPDIDLPEVESSWGEEAELGGKAARYEGGKEDGASAACEAAESSPSAKRPRA